MSRFAERWPPRQFRPMGQLFVVPAQTAIDVVNGCREQRSVICQFDPDAAQAWFGPGFEWTSERLSRGLDLRSPELRRLLQRMASELLRPGHASRDMVAAMATQACVHLARLLLDVGTRRCGGLAAWRLRVIEEALDRCPGEARVADLARRCGMSSRQLSRAFHESRGETLAAYIAGHRLARACVLLSSGASVKAAAHEAGFASPRNFATAFRRTMGCTPSEFPVCS